MIRWGVLLCLAAAPAQARFHAAVGPDGSLQIRNQPAPGFTTFQPLAQQHAHPRPVTTRPPARIGALIGVVAAEHQLDAALLHAVIQQESGYRPAAVSAAGAVGLMQLMPATAQRFGVRDRFDPEQNLRGGAAYLAWLLQHFGQYMELALAAYNAGEGAVRRHGNRVPPYPETRAYVRRVLHTYHAP